MKRLAFMLLFVSVFGLQLSAAGQDLRVIKTYKLGGDGGWDYLTVDPESHHLFISRSTQVIVIDTESGKPVGDIPDTPGVHGIALANDLGRGFTSNGREGTVSIFDLKTFKLISKVQPVATILTRSCSIPPPGAYSLLMAEATIPPQSMPRAEISSARLNSAASPNLA